MYADRAQITSIIKPVRLDVIPFFQRRYVWGEDEWNQFLDDMCFISETDQEFFLGTVILKAVDTASTEKISEKREIIDGQQRITTITIFFKVLCLFEGKDKYFRNRFMLVDDDSDDALPTIPAIQHNRLDEPDFNHIVNLSKLDDVEGESQIYRCYRFFKAQIRERHSQLNRDRIMNRCLFVSIDLPSDEDEQQVFDTMNSRGVMLTTAELLKNYFYGRDDIKQYEKFWAPTFESEESLPYWDKEVRVGNQYVKLIELFFISFLRVLVNRPEGPLVSANSKVRFERTSELFRSFKEYIKNYRDDDKTAVLDEMLPFTKSFRHLFDPDLCNERTSKEYGIARINVVIFALRQTTLIPYVLYLHSQIGDGDLFDRMLGILETFFMRRIIVGAQSRGYNNLATYLINHGIVKEDMLIKELSTYTDDGFQSNGNLKSAFEERHLYNDFSKGVLYLIESRIRHPQHSTELLGINSYSLEHIMPKKWRNHWGSANKSEATDRDNYCLTLGNLTILPASLNSSLKDKNWTSKVKGDKKHAGYRKLASEIETFQEALTDKQWTVDSIKDRSNQLYMWAINDVWPIP